jgi:hypothetical protein
MNLTKENLKKLIKEEMEDILGRDDPMRGKLTKFEPRKPSEEDKTRARAADDAGHQMQGIKFAANELNNLIATLKRDKYFKATDPVYAALDELTSLIAKSE